MLVVPATLVLVFLLLYFSMRNLRDVLLIYTWNPVRSGRRRVYFVAARHSLQRQRRDRIHRDLRRSRSRTPETAANS